MESLNKKGQAHIEMIMSFMLFIGFLLFMLIVFRPFSPVLDIKMVDQVFANLDQGLSVDVNSISIKFNATQIGSDFDIGNTTNFTSVAIGRACSSGANFLVRGSDGNVLTPTEYGFTPMVNETFLKIQADHVDLTNPMDFYTIVCSSEFSSAGGIAGGGFEVNSSQSMTNREMEFSRLFVKRAWSNTSLVHFQGNYTGGKYHELRQKYLPLGNAFALDVMLVNGSEVITTTTSSLPSGNIFVKAFPIEVVYPTGEVNRAVVQVYVW